MGVEQRLQSAYSSQAHLLSERSCLFLDNSKHKEINIYAHYDQILNGKTNIIGIIQSLVNILTTAPCALLLHSMIIKIL